MAVAGGRAREAAMTEVRLNDGGYAVATAPPVEPSYLDVQRYDAAGEPVGPHTSTRYWNGLGGFHQPVMAAAPDGGFIVAAGTATRYDAELYVERFDAGGVKV